MFLSKSFFFLLQPFVQQQIDIFFFARPEKKIDTRKSRKGNQETLKTSKGRRNEEKT